MVMWLPEIDGKYEVPEMPEIEHEPTKLEQEKEKTKAAEKQVEKERTEKEKEKAEAKKEREQRKKAEEKAERAEQAKVELEKKVEKETKELKKQKHITVNLENQLKSEKKSFFEKISRVTENLKIIREKFSFLVVSTLFPNEKFTNENGVMVSTTRKKEASQGNEHEKFSKEMEISRDLYNNGHSIWLIPEKTDTTLEFPIRTQSWMVL